MIKKFFILLVLFPLALAGCSLQSKPAETVDTLAGKTILYYGSSCPHCKIVEQYMDDNKVAEKMTIEQKEVYGNQANAKEMAAVASRCGLSTNKIGVPFLWVENKCLVGDVDINNYFKTKLKL